MYCQRCGAQNEDGMQFCQQCGMKLDAAPAAPGRVGAVPPMPGPAAVLSPAEQIKAIGRSPFYLTGVIAYTCAVLFSLINAVMVPANFSQYLYQLMSLSDIGLTAGPEVWQALELVDRFGGSTALLGALLGQLPAILICVGMWLLFASACNRSQAPVSTVGLTMIKVVAIIQLVLFGLIIALAETGLGMLLAELLDYGGHMSGPRGVTIFLIIFILVIAALVVTYYVLLVKTINAIGTTLRTRTPSDKVSVYVAVCCFITGGFSAIMAIAARGGVVSLLAGLCSATASITFGCFLFSYRSRMRMLALAPVPVPVPVPVPAPVPPETAGGPFQPAGQMPLPPQPVPPAPAPSPDTTVLSEPMPANNETTVLRPEASPLPPARLVHLRSGAVVAVDRAPFCIGKDPAVTDLCVSDNTAISRRHADILYQNGAFLVVDLRSTNHVYINDRQIPPQTPTELPSGAILRLGDELFRFEVG